MRCGMLATSAATKGEPDFEDLVVCYDILETTLVELIEDKRAKLDAEIAAIIDRKGKPRS